MNDQPRTGDGYNEDEKVQKDVLLDARMKKFQADFVKETKDSRLAAFSINVLGKIRDAKK